MAPDGSCLLTLGALSVQTAPDGYRRIVWMIIGMIKAHSIRRRMPRTPDGQVVADYTRVSAVPGAGRAGDGRASMPQYPGLTRIARTRNRGPWSRVLRGHCGGLTR